MIPTAAPTVNPQHTLVLSSYAVKNIVEAGAPLQLSISVAAGQSLTPHLELLGLSSSKLHAVSELEWHGILEMSFFVTSFSSSSPNSLKVSIVTSIPATPRIFLIDD